MQSPGLSNTLPILTNNTDRFVNGKKSLTILPTLHNQVQFSVDATLEIQSQFYEMVLVELPSNLHQPLLKGIDRLPLVTVVHTDTLKTKGDTTLTPHPSQAYIIHPGESIYWSAYVSRREGIPVEFIDNWHVQGYQTWQIPLGYEHIAAIGWTKFWNEENGVVGAHFQNNIHRTRSRNMTQRVVASLIKYDNILVVCGAAHWPAIVAGLESEGWDVTNSMVPTHVYEKYQLYLSMSDDYQDTEEIPTFQLSDVHPHTIHLVTGDLPYFLGKMVEEPLDFNKLDYLRQIFFDAEKKYFQKFDDNVSIASFQRLLQYLRNLGRIHGQILPDLYNIIAAAKGMGDGDYAFEVYRTAIGYPYLPNEENKLDNELKFIPDENQGEVIKFAFKRRFKQPVLRKVDRDEFEDLDPIPDEDYPGQWQEIWDEYSPFGYVSYPPEDEFIENYMQFLRNKIIEILMEEESSTLEFETSLEDGIDWRETMRHYHEKKIYVKKYPKNRYKVGALIVQFLEEPFDEKEYSHHSTLFAEHNQESHISVITTTPGDVIVGPGISRVKYAAIISQFPPVGMPYLISKQNYPIKLRLIWSAMNMSLNKIIGFVAKKPPTAAQRHFASEHGYRIVYLPMGQLTAQSLRRLRTMHLLAHRDLRDRAREYIGF